MKKNGEKRSEDKENSYGVGSVQGGGGDTSKKKKREKNKRRLRREANKERRREKFLGFGARVAM